LFPGRRGYLGDTDAFAIISDRQKHDAIVFLDSPGGNIQAATWIGWRIRERGFKTAVADGARCLSACAMIWMGGEERYLGTKAHLGFHSAQNRITKEVSQFGNEVMAGYLQKMGVNDVEAARLISAPPTSMTWVNVESLATYGITASHLQSAPQVVWPIARKRQIMDPTAPAFRG
jgi:hypothetical protein